MEISSTIVAAQACGLEWRAAASAAAATMAAAFRHRPPPRRPFVLLIAVLIVVLVGVILCVILVVDSVSVVVSLSSRPLVAPAGCCLSPLLPYPLALSSRPLVWPAGCCVTHATVALSGCTGLLSSYRAG